jgi:Fe-S cluster assembly protein SufD
MIELRTLENAVRRDEPAWMSGLRRDAMDRFAALGFPTTHDEDWKYTSVSPIAKVAFQPGALATADLGFPLADLGCDTRLVFVNGRFSRELSSLDKLPRGVKAGSLAELLRDGNATLESHLARYAEFNNHAFVALNTALAEDGAVVEAARDVVLEQPIHLLFVSMPDGRPTMSHPRNLILAGRGSRAAVIETYAGPAGAVYLTNAVTEIVVGEGAVMDHYKLQHESEQGFHVATLQAVQDRGSVLNSHNVSFGAALARSDINSVLDAEGTECYLNGLFIAAGRQHVDNHTMLDHAKPHSNSRELYKGILGGSAMGVFHGKIVVRKDAQKINAIQSNRNLLLSGHAVINTKPQLEIFADDVRCTHGATVGQLDKEALFYMQSRGIAAAEARSLLTYAFAGEVLDRMRWQPVRRRLEDELRRILSNDWQGGAKC